MKIDSSSTQNIWRFQDKLSPFGVKQSMFIFCHPSVGIKAAEGDPENTLRVSDGRLDLPASSAFLHKRRCSWLFQQSYVRVFKWMMLPKLAKDSQKLIPFRITSPSSLASVKSTLYNVFFPGQPQTTIQVCMSLLY